MKKWKPYLIGVVATLAVGGLSALLSRSAMDVYNETAVKPAFSPPMWLFPVVWSILYGLMGVSAARVWMQESSAERSRGLNLYIAQLAVNFFWSLLFFNARAYGFAALWLLLLWLLVLAMILTFRKTDPLAAKLQIPYLLWLTFALYLNISVWQLN